MKFIDLPEGTKYFDVDSVAVADLPSGECWAFADGKGVDVEGRVYANRGKVARDGPPAITRAEFKTWLETGRSPFMT